MTILLVDDHKLFSSGMNSDDDSLYRAMKYGASGYLLKNFDAGPGDCLLCCEQSYSIGVQQDCCRYYTQ